MGATPWDGEVLAAELDDPTISVGAAQSDAMWTSAMVRIASMQWDFLNREFKATLGSQSSNLGFRVLNLSNNERPVAYLVSREPADGPIVLPIGPGATLVGRAALANYVAERTHLAGIIEGVQWRITWSAEKVSICDAGSTNGSALIRRADREEMADTLGELQQDPRALRLGWDGSQPNDAIRLLADGDVLVNAYGQFLYCGIDDASGAFGQ